LRLDHVMALQRLWCIPEHSQAREGGYLNYDLTDLLGIVALESQRNQCLVVGEDLGTVPGGFRERLRATQILSYRVLHFERVENGAFLPAESYPRLALAAAGNHDLPPLRGWLLARDLELRAAQSADAGTSVPATREARQREVALLRRALSEAGLAAPADPADPKEYAAFMEAVHRFLGRTPCLLAMVQLDDWAGEVDPVNLPGTTDEYPNWRRKLSLTLEEVLASPKWRTLYAHR
jgi:4-alpha-glucanotransferase